MFEGASETLLVEFYSLKLSSLSSPHSSKIGNVSVQKMMIMCSFFVTQHDDHGDYDDIKVNVMITMILCGSMSRKQGVM